MVENEGLKQVFFSVYNFSINLFFGLEDETYDPKVGLEGML
jgi:hypothetical protein